ncbi:MAG: cupredoxin domain-containing protein [Methanoregula sp.]|jgi:plastocyanin|nr:cupredoxin domain-containing protein [Methanoregula sp.]
MKKFLILLMAAALLLATCGCTESTPEGMSTPVPTAPASSPTDLPTTTMPTLEPTPSVNDNTISIKRDGFSPATMTVKKGSTVRWVNLDSTDDPALYNPTHRIKIIGVDTGQTLSPGQGWSRVFTDTGSFDYEDMIHTDMHGTVIVE